MKSDRSFKEFLHSGHSFFTAISVLVVGVLFIIISSFSGGQSVATEEERLAEICSSVDGVGRCRAVITYGEDEEAVFAVAVLCEGADSVYVRERINRLISSLYGIGTNRIAVLKID